MSSAGAKAREDSLQAMSLAHSQSLGLGRKEGVEACLRMAREIYKRGETDFAKGWLEIRLEMERRGWL